MKSKAQKKPGHGPGFFHVSVASGFAARGEGPRCLGAQLGSGCSLGGGLLGRSSSLLGRSSSLLGGSSSLLGRSSSLLGRSSSLLGRSSSLLGRSSSLLGGSSSLLGGSSSLLGRSSCLLGGRGCLLGRSSGLHRLLGLVFGFACGLFACHVGSPGWRFKSTGGVTSPAPVDPHETMMALPSSTAPRTSSNLASLAVYTPGKNRRAYASHQTDARCAQIMVASCLN